MNKKGGQTLEKAEFGENLFRLRKKAGLSQEELAERVGVHLNTISQWENGFYVPKTLKVKRLAEALNVTEAELLNGPAKQELEVKIMMGVKSLTGLAGVEIASNSFIYGVQDDEPQIVLAGKVRIDTPEQREQALAEIIRKFKAACWMFDHKDEAES
ncbi:MAG: helix-turn-helix domain-containing protein [Synergistaceae bacterium]|nr:helix-turn-helix domain-containing protein [Synergistaceae bacterium]